MAHLVADSHDVPYQIYRVTGFAAVIDVNISREIAIGEMEIVSRRTPRSKKPVDYETESAHSKLRFYRYPPTGTLSLQEFENFALERLKGTV